MGKKRDGWSSPLLRLQMLLEKDHEIIWERLLYCKRYMDETYFCQLCQYLWQYIVYGIVLKFENPVMQNTLLEFMALVDGEIEDVSIEWIMREPQKNFKTK